MMNEISYSGYRFPPEIIQRRNLRTLKDFFAEISPAQIMPLGLFHPK